MVLIVFYLDCLSFDGPNCEVGRGARLPVAPEQGEKMAAGRANNGIIVSTVASPFQASKAATTKELCLLELVKVTDLVKTEFS